MLVKFPHGLSLGDFSRYDKLPYRKIAKHTHKRKLVYLPMDEDVRAKRLEPLISALGDQFTELRISLVVQDAGVADATTVLLLRDSRGQPRAVALCSSPAAPDMVERAMNRARKAKEILGPIEGVHILEPWTEGKFGGLSYAVLPYCEQLSDSRYMWWMQRALLRRPLLNWLWGANECSMREVTQRSLEARFVRPLQHIMSLARLSNLARVAARRAIESLDAGTWQPKYVLMHGDLWKGNILIRQTSATAVDQARWPDRFVVIDWPGSESEGYPIYDLVRLTQSIRLGRRAFRREVERHCRLLKCQPPDTLSYLVAALGHIGTRLEHFPFERFVIMSETCVETLQGVLA
jgi:hypothetical protein